MNHLGLCVLWKAKMLLIISDAYESCQLLTGDKALREVARVAFQRMKSSGSRLPWGEVEKILMRRRLSHFKINHLINNDISNENFPHTPRNTPNLSRLEDNNTVGC